MAIGLRQAVMTRQLSCGIFVTCPSHHLAPDLRGIIVLSTVLALAQMGKPSFLPVMTSIFGFGISREKTEMRGKLRQDTRLRSIVLPSAQMVQNLLRLLTTILSSFGIGMGS